MVYLEAREKQKKERFNVLVTAEKTEFKEKRDELIQKEQSLAWYYLGLVGQMGFAVALPIATGALGGRYIDKWLGTTPKATLLFLFIGIAVSCIGFFGIIREIIHKRTY